MNIRIKDLGVALLLLACASACGDENTDNDGAGGANNGGASGGEKNVGGGTTTGGKDGMGSGGKGGMGSGGMATGGTGGMGTGGMATGGAGGMGTGGQAPATIDYLVAGLEDKVTWNDQGAFVFTMPGKDKLAFYDLTDPAKPALTETLTLSNSVFGPPTNIVFSPDNKVAFVSDSIETKDNPAMAGTWTFGPSHFLHVIDLTKPKPTLVSTIDTVDLQPSGLAISPDGKTLMAANRNGKSVTVFTVSGTTVTRVEAVPMVEAVVGMPAKQAAAVAFISNTSAVVCKHDAMGAVGFLSFAGGKWTYDPTKDIAVGPWAYNVLVTPDGKLALTADTGGGNGGKADGMNDTVSVIDLTVSPPVKLGTVTVADAPEGMAISPDGKMALVGHLSGNNLAVADPNYRATGADLVVLSIDTATKKVEKVGNPIIVGRLPEGIKFSRDGSHAYVGNFLSSDLTVLKIAGGTATIHGEPVKLSGRPAAIR
jgi:DNA-binding beta-propeller fold protein YncE